MVTIRLRHARRVTVACAVVLGGAGPDAILLAQVRPSVDESAVGEPGAIRTVDGMHVVPHPTTVTPRAGAFVLTNPVRIVVDSSSARLAEIGGFLAGVIRQRSGFRVIESQRRLDGPAIVLAVASDAPPEEGYELTVAPRTVLIRSGGVDGVFWGVQTLRQLLPPGFEDLAGARPDSWRIAAIAIADAPRFAWRGSLMDVGRHFFPVDFVKRYIDLLSRYKMNVLHWHLTEDQGWRLEIMKYPKLTGIGAWRTEADGSRYGGFYSQDEIRDVVEYARRRNVTVVPEIEMPGHSQAAIASYPELGCTGEPVPVANRWGVFKEVYCPGNERTFTFLQDVLDEVMALFPSEYIHIGGDEVPKDRWRECASCQALMRREGLANEDELQSWFIQRIARYLADHDRRLVGWDEIIEGGLAEGATVQVWRDMAHATTAVQRGHDVIVSPTSHAYLNQGPRELPLGRVWSFDPVPPGLTAAEAARVLGGEATLWSEYISTANFDAIAFPRLLAMSEVLWTRAPRDSMEFLDRVRGGQAQRLEAMGVGAGPEDQDLVRMTTAYDAASGAVRVHVERGMDAVTVRYTTNGSAPGAASPVYDGSVEFSTPGVIRFRAFLDGEPLPREHRLAIEQHLARGKPVRLRTPGSDSYPGTGAFTLTDGLLGTTDHHDGIWQGWAGADLEATIDLGTAVAIHVLRASFLQATPSWVLLPRDVAFSFSVDGERWTTAGRVSHAEPAERDESFRHVFEQAVADGSVARFIRIVARNAGPLPAWHPGAGRPSWIFADEVTVR